MKLKLENQSLIEEVSTIHEQYKQLKDRFEVDDVNHRRQSLTNQSIENENVNLKRENGILLQRLSQQELQISNTTKERDDLIVER